MPHSSPNLRARARGVGGSPAGALRVVVLVTLALPFVCGGDGAKSWVNLAGAELDRAPRPPGPPHEPQTRIAALRPSVGPQPCRSAAECAAGEACTVWFEDADGDGFGNPDTARGFCGEHAPASKLPRVDNDRDCCDLDDRVRPTQTEAFAERIAAACPLARGYDYDCDGVLRYGDDMGASVWAGACDASTNAGNEPHTPCVERAGVFLGPGNALGLTTENLLTAAGDAALCGNASVEWKSCEPSGSACEGHSSFAPPCN
jgi:hypothetical protein